MFFIKADRAVSTVETLKQVATIIVRNGTKILMGKRNDNGRYTNPGGHMEEGEDPREAAVRELKEEAGIEVESEDLKHLATQDVITFTGKKMKIHAYMVDSKQKPSSKNDPDEEVDKWEWIDVKDGLADEIKENLHSPKNLALFALKLIKSEGIEKADKPFHGYNKEKHSATGGLNSKFRAKYNRENGSNLKAPVTESKPTGKAAARKRSFCARMSGVKGPTSKEGKLTPKGAALKRWKCKSDFYIMDLVKSAASGAHKYLRKYQRGGQWIYIYHEGTEHGRRLDPAKVELMKRLAASGHADSKHLIDNVQEHAPGKLDLLRRLADAGHEQSHGHLKSLGIDRAQEKLEEKLVPRAIAPQDKMDKELSDEDRGNMANALRKEIQASTTHLSNHQTEEIGRKVYPVLSAAGLLTELNKAKTLRQGLDALANVAHKLETAQGETAAQRPGSHKTYGNNIYNKGLEALKADGLIPQEYVDEHKREARSGVATHKDLKGIQDRADARQAAEVERKRLEEEAERRELGAYLTKVDEIGHYYSKTFSSDDKKRLAKGIRNVFGARFSMNSLDKAMNPDPTNKTNLRFDSDFLQGLMNSSSSEASFTFEIQIQDRSTGRAITSCRRDIKKSSDGSIVWHNQVFRRPHNNDLKKYSGMSKGLYGGVESFLKDITVDLPQAAKDRCRTYTSGANSGWSDDGYKGALLWAKHYFNFTNPDTANTWRSGYTSQIDHAKRKLPQLAADLESFKTKMASFKHPYQFVKSGIMVSKAEAIAFVGHQLDFDYNQKFAATPAVDLAEIMLINSQMNLPCENYFNRSTGDAGALNVKRTAYYEDSGTRERNSSIAASPAIRSERVRAMLNGDWKPSKGRSVVMTDARLNEMQSWSKEEVEEFYRHAPITRAAKQRVKEILDRIGG